MNAIFPNIMSITYRYLGMVLKFSEGATVHHLFITVFKNGFGMSMHRGNLGAWSNSVSWSIPVDRKERAPLESCVGLAPFDPFPIWPDTGVDGAKCPCTAGAIVADSRRASDTDALILSITPTISNYPSNVQIGHANPHPAGLMPMQWYVQTWMPLNPPTHHLSRICDGNQIRMTWITMHLINHATQPRTILVAGSLIPIVAGIGRQSTHPPTQPTLDPDPWHAPQSRHANIHPPKEEWSKHDPPGVYMDTIIACEKDEEMRVGKGNEAKARQEGSSDVINRKVMFTFS